MDAAISLDEAIDLTRTGDIWIFRGRTGADRAIQTLTNSPVNHVGMSIVVEDMPPLMWHAELGKSLPDLWSGTFQRGVQLHDLRDAVTVWAHRYGQRGWLRQLEPGVSKEMEDKALKTVARLDGTPFPSSAQLAWRWVRGRVPQVRPRWRVRGGKGPATEAALETAYCAEVVAVTYEDMGLLPRGKQPNWYDPGRFWSGDDLDLSDGFTLSDEIEVDIPAG
ncbi:hypothetical protein Aab01nite_30060 [Paractinoplanes abujensis]|uniref:Guanylate cyclase n=1 Tax=Paractinoplanes abujensis TaxID=882441 RepID=A0A7W7D0P1_9ACTN|nr:hypothetical protein [Actinoplanes abujensis]MBB4698097.1 hypothetical protein [Actinoplanes abujensis]GID19416.1 hypothetical protein Aab01nite_30060 [Actinoplanes abujensis]